MSKSPYYTSAEDIERMRKSLREQEEKIGKRGSPYPRRRTVTSDINYNMCPKEFAKLENNIFAIIPKNGIELFEVIKLAKEEFGYNASNTKAAILGLKASGRISLNDDGTVLTK
jgi:hypothetical protein